MELRGRLQAPLTAALVVAVIFGFLWWLDGPRGPETLAGPPKPQDVLSGESLSPVCNTRRPFQPVHAVITGVGADVVALPRDSANVPSTPPLTRAGKRQIAWDEPPGVLPGSRTGNVLLNTHTWPDGSALGNLLLDKLTVGDVFELRGKRGQRLCYRVTERVEVLAADGFPRYYQDAGKPQAALIVCSGTRLRPGEWTHRTIWFASPVDSPTDSPGAGRA